MGQVVGHENMKQGHPIIAPSMRLRIHVECAPERIMGEIPEMPIVMEAVLPENLMEIIALKGRERMSDAGKVLRLVKKETVRNQEREAQTVRHMMKHVVLVLRFVRKGIDADRRLRDFAPRVTSSIDFVTVKGDHLRRNVDLDQKGIVLLRVRPMREVT